MRTNHLRLIILFSTMGLLFACQPLITTDERRAIEAKNAKVSTTLAKLFKPHKSFEEYVAPAAPDYSLPEFWAALPSKEDEADHIVDDANLSDQQASAEVDVFYIHPTTFSSKDAWNADAMSDLQMGQFRPVKMQASIFNGSAKVYAPRYRQAGVYSFVEKPLGKEALAVANEDVMTAFHYYLEHFNRGRPFFLAGHSQGTYHSAKILKYLDENPTPQFIAAYIPGETIKSSWYNNIKPCHSRNDLSCYMVWNTKRWGTQQEELIPISRFEGAVCTNPLSWKTNEKTVAKEKHLGAINLDFTTFDRHVIEAAKCDKQTLWIKISDDLKYHSRLDDNWHHMMDFNLFYLNVRENVKERIAAYKESKNSSN